MGHRPQAPVGSHKLEDCIRMIKKSKPAQNETHLFEIKRHLFKYQISLPACFTTAPLSSGF